MYMVLVALLVIEMLLTTLGVSAYFLWLLDRVRHATWVDMGVKMYGHVHVCMEHMQPFEKKYLFLNTSPKQSLSSVTPPRFIRCRLPAPAQHFLQSSCSSPVA